MLCLFFLLTSTTLHDIAAPPSVCEKQVKEYSFNRVLGPGSTQEEVYRLTTQPLVDALYMGKSGACVWVCISLCVCVSVSVGGWGRWVFLDLPAPAPPSKGISTIPTTPDTHQRPKQTNKLTNKLHHRPPLCLRRDERRQDLHHHGERGGAGGAAAGAGRHICAAGAGCGGRCWGRGGRWRWCWCGCRCGHDGAGGGQVRACVQAFLLLELLN